MSEINYLFHLAKYDGPSSRLTCPNCGRPHCFTPYVDKDGVPADPKRYGRFDHESNCGYCEYPPAEGFRQGGYPFAMRKPKKQPLRTNPALKSNPSTIPEDIVRRTVVFTPKNTFLSFLSRIFDEEAAKSMMELYRIGTTKDGFTVFYQIDIHGCIRTGKIIPYNPETGHRIKDGSVPEAMWVHSRLKSLHQLPDMWELTQCLFGEHLLALYPDKPVALVEAEKTAVICAAAMPDYLWVATGGKHQFNDRLLVLKGRNVVAFPDIDAYVFWRDKARQYPALNIKVSDYLERTATDEERELKIDLADRLLQKMVDVD